MRKVWMILCLAVMAMFLVSCQGRAISTTSEITMLRIQNSRLLQENAALLSQLQSIPEMEPVQPYDITMFPEGSYPTKRVINVIMYQGPEPTPPESDGTIKGRWIHHIGGKDGEAWYWVWNW